MRVETIKNCGELGAIAPDGTERIVFLTNSFKDKFRAWAIRNAFSIGLLAAAFVVTWLLLSILILTNTRN